MRKLLATFLTFIAFLEVLRYVTLTTLVCLIGLLFAAAWFMDLLLDYARPE
jgi:hypothetical protein